MPACAPLSYRPKVRRLLTAGLVTLAAMAATVGQSLESEQSGATTDSDPPLRQSSVVVYAENLLEARFVNLVFTEDSPKIVPENFVLRSADDPKYAAGLTPVRCSLWARPVRYSIRKPLTIKATSIFLALPHPFEPACHYTLETRDLAMRPMSPHDGTASETPVDPPRLELRYRGDRGRSPLIHVNQAGYPPGARKYAYLTGYLGIDPASPDEPVDFDATAYDSFEIIDADSLQTVSTGRVELSPVCRSTDGARPDRLSGGRVWELDFSGFCEPGRYRIAVSGLGVSYPFTISPRSYNVVLGTLMRGVYHQRCGTDLASPWTRHTHPPCHLDDARIPELAEYRHDELPFFEQKAASKHPCPGGHHDAGDYGKYVTNGAAFAGYLLQALEVYPHLLAFDASPIPESGNGIPDLVDELVWELRWLSAMQDPADGGVHTIVKPHPTMSYENGVAGSNVSEKFAEPRTVWWKDLPATAAYAAVLAKAARSPMLKTLDDEQCNRWLKKARKAWAFCQRETDEQGAPNKGVGGHHYGQFLGPRDEYTWAAIELWLATGEQEFHDYFLEHHDPAEGWNWGWWPLKDAHGLATRAYAYAVRDGKHPEMLAACVSGPKGVLAAARAACDWQRGWATRPSFAEDPYRFGRWGWYFLSDIATYDLLLAASLTEAEEADRFRQAALFNTDHELGNHAGDVVSITGLGYRRPIDHVHQASRYDQIVEPVPGIPLGFHPAGFNRGSGDRELMSRFTHGGLPIAHRYVDCWYVNQEFTVQELATTLASYAMLADTASQTRGAPSLTITANGSETMAVGSAPLEVFFEAEAEGAAGKQIRYFFWDLATEDCVNDRRFTWTFDTPGIYPVVCTVTDDDGWIRFREVSVKVSQPPEELPGKGVAFKPTDSTRAYWTFDEGLADTVSGIPATLTGNARCQADNLLWMREPAGRSVQFNAASDGVRVELPLRLLNDPAIRRFHVEAVVHWEADVPRGRGHSEILLLDAAWNIQFGVHQDTWAGRELCLPGNKKQPLDTIGLDRFGPAAGWRLMAMGVDRDLNRGFLEIGGERTEFPVNLPASDHPNVLQIGGFVGHLDELRIIVED